MNQYNVRSIPTLVVIENVSLPEEVEKVLDIIYKNKKRN